MTVLGSDDSPLSHSDALQTALLIFTERVCSPLGVCSYGLTMGEQYVPFDPDEDDDCEEDEAYCSQAWVRVDNLTFETSESWGNTCGGEIVLTIEVGVLRCVEVPEGGEAPSATDVASAALQAMDDMYTIHCAAMKEDDPEDELWLDIESQQWTPSGPLGGQAGGVWVFQVKI